MTDTRDIEVGDDLEITTVEARWIVGGVWVKGRLNGHRFEALVFPERAQRGEWELHGGRISKLWIKRLETPEVVFEWDRGMVRRASTALAGEIADFLAAGLADHIFGR